MSIRRGRAVAALLVAALAVGLGLSNSLGEGGDSGGGFDAGDLSLRQLAGERLVSGFPGRTPPPALRRMIRRGEIAGVVLFSGNLGDRSATRELIRALQSIRRPRGLRDPLLVMIDQEGGEVKRLRGPPNASAAQMGQRGPGFSRRQGRLTGHYLAALGINVDLAPVLDVERPASVIGEEQRSFGASAAKVSATAVPFAVALQAAGVAATGKHFPGLGAASMDTDVGVERIDLPERALRSVDEAPFGGFAAAGGKLVMISSAIYPAFSPRPAAFAPEIASGELRQRLGFDGVSITDELGAAAAKAFGSPQPVARAATAAGTDLLLFRSYRSAGRAGAALRSGLRRRTLPRADFVESAQRVLDLRRALVG